jgi:hypothetical protein
MVAKTLFLVLVFGSASLSFQLSGAPTAEKPVQQGAAKLQPAPARPKALPDLEVLGYHRADARGSLVQIRIKNTGSGSSEACYGTASAIFKSGLEGSPTVKLAIPALAPGAKVDLPAEIAPPPLNQGAYLGEHTYIVTITADARKQVQEVDEANNVFKTFEQAKGKSGGSQIFGDNWGK